jgi:hypothetical protein
MPSCSGRASLSMRSLKNKIVLMKLTSNSGLRMGYFWYTLSPIAGIVDRMGILARAKLLYDSLLVLFYFEAFKKNAPLSVALTATLYNTISHNYLQYQFVLKLPLLLDTIHISTKK